MPDLSAHLEATAQAQQRRGTRRTLSTARQPEQLDLATNDYLGLTRDPGVVAAATDALQRYGTGSGGSRALAGNLPLHVELDQALAELTGAPAVVSVASGYAANLAAVTSLVVPDGCVILDSHAHASLVDGARLSGAPVRWADHNDPDHVEQLLTRHGRPGALVLVESLYSALGDAAPLAELASVCARHGATLLVDEAHGIGVLGPDERLGAGGAAAAGIVTEPHVVLTGALGKACASQGGFIAGSRSVIDHMVSSGRALIYDTAAGPAAVAAAAQATRRILADPALVIALHENAAALARALGQQPPVGGIISVPVGASTAAALPERAAAEGIVLGVFRPGSTPDGRHRLRITAHAQMTADELARASRFLNTVHPQR